MMAAAAPRLPLSPSRLPIDERSRQALEARLIDDGRSMDAFDLRRNEGARDRIGDAPIPIQANAPAVGKQGLGTDEAGKKRKRKPENPTKYDPERDVSQDGRKIRSRVINGQDGGSGSGGDRSGSGGGNSRHAPGPRVFEGPLAQASPDSPGAVNRQSSAPAPGPTVSVSGVILPVGSVVAPGVHAPLPAKAGSAAPRGQTAAGAVMDGSPTHRAAPAKVTGSGTPPPPDAAGMADTDAKSSKKAVTASAAQSGKATVAPGGSMAAWLMKPHAGGAGQDVVSPPQSGPLSQGEAGAAGSPPIANISALARVRPAVVAAADMPPPPPVPATAKSGKSAAAGAASQVAKEQSNTMLATMPGGAGETAEAARTIVGVGAASGAAGASSGQRATVALAPAAVVEELRAKVAKLEQEKARIDLERKRHSENSARCKEQIEEMSREREEAARNFADYLVSLAKFESSQQRREFSEKQSRIGRHEIREHRSLSGAYDRRQEFIPGSEFRMNDVEIAELEAKLANLAVRMADVQKRKKANKSSVAKKPTAGAGGGRAKGKKAQEAAAAAAAAALSVAGLVFGDDATEAEDGDAEEEDVPPGDIYTTLELMEEEERYKVERETTSKKLDVAKAKKSEMEREVMVMAHEARRQRLEDESRHFMRTLIPGKRYFLMQLLGKGGNGEVWKAVDLYTGHELAIKLNMLDQNWSDDKRTQYVRHVVRELDIMKMMRHQNIVEYVDTVHVSSDCIAMVMEYCRGDPLDLDKVLKVTPQLAEREARAILLQILSALRYMNGVRSTATAREFTTTSSLDGFLFQDAGASAGGGVGGGLGPNRRIIHYDLKPANILFDEYGAAKVADFGLSKILRDEEGQDEATSMELTSQGAGTLWYLPPECFSVPKARISNKVDVFSTGVIFYQMLYGRKPFGEGVTQTEYATRIGRLDMGEVQFPPDTKDTKVTEQAKAFLRRALALHVDARPDVAAICCDPYLRHALSSKK